MRRNHETMNLTSQVDCKHFVDDQQVPCPPMCPVQAWPRHMFKRTLFRGRLVLRPEFERVGPHA